MQAVVVTRAVREQQRGRASLAGLVAASEKLPMLARVPHGHAQPLVPAVGERRELWVERGTQRGDERRQRVGEVLVLTTPESVTAHHHAGAEQRIVRVPAADELALGGREQALDDRVALIVEVLPDAPPVESRQPLGNATVGAPGDASVRGRLRRLVRGSARRPGVERPAAHCRASRSSSARLRSAPQR